MKIQILIGMLVTASFLASCGAELEERTPTPATENATTSVGEPAGQLGSEADVSIGDDQAVLEPLIPAQSATTTAPVQASNQPTPTTTTPPESTEETSVAGSGEVTVGGSTATDADASGLPEPGGPWVDPRQPDFTKTVPPPQD